MKMYLFAALAFAVATPAAAQTAPATQHQGHAQHGTPQSGGHAQHQGQGQQPGHDQHQGHDMQSGCCADRNNNGRMDCCENMAEGQSCCPNHGQRQPAQPPAQPNR